MSDFRENINHSRRRFLAQALSTGALCLVPDWLHTPSLDLQAEEPKTKSSLAGKGKAKHLIILFLQGGPSHLDTFDPKNTTDPNLPRQIATSVDGIQLSEFFPKLAQKAENFSIIRSIQSREGNHQRARYYVHTGYAPNPTVQHPSFGAILSREKGPKDSILPHFVAINGDPGGAEYLGPAYAPLLITNPEQGLENLEYAPSMTPERMQKRLLLRQKADRHFREKRNKAIPDAQALLYEKAKQLMDSPQAKAFDLSQEKTEQIERYGQGRFGKGVLLARRLIEEGVTCVEVSLNGWDTHADNYSKVQSLSAELDLALSQLITDLKERGLLKETMIACYGEFGRSPKLNERKGRDHYPQVWSMLLAGGPIQGGKIIGASDERGEKITQDPIHVPDVFRSFSHAFDFEAFREFEVNDRPISYIDKESRIITELFQ